MFTRFEDYAATVMLGRPDSPPRSDGRLRFGRDWERTLFGMALALSKQGYFEWEDFRQRLIGAIAQWEQGVVAQCEGQPPWDYYERFMLALFDVLDAAGIVRAQDLPALLAGETAPPGGRPATPVHGPAG